MILLVQLLLFAAVLGLRWWRLTGRQLAPVRDAALAPMLEEVRRSKSKVVARSVGLELTGAYPILVVRERWYHGLLKALGLAGEVEVGDAALDAKWFVVAGRPDHLRWALLSAPLRASLGRLLGLPIKAVRSSRTRAWLELEEEAFGKELGELKGYVDLLAGGPDRGEDPSAARRRQPWPWVAVHTALLVIGLVGLVVPFLDREVLVADPAGLWTRSALIGALVASAWYLALRLRFAGTGWLTWLTADFLFVGLAGLFLCTAHVVRAANQGLDEAPPRPAACAVLSKGCWLECWRGSGKSKKTRTHPLAIEACGPERRQATLRDWQARDGLCVDGARFQLATVFRSWREGEPPLQVWMAAAAWDATAVGQPVLVPVHPGALGIEWWEPARVAPASPTGR